MKAANHSAAARRSSISSAASPRSCFLAFSRHAGHTLTHVSRACRVGSRPRLQVCAARLDDPNSNRLTSIAKKVSDTDIDGIFEATDRAATTAQTLNIEQTSNKLLGFNQSVLTQATAANGTRRTVSNVISAISYQLDANGNLTSDGLRTFEYNAENRLDKVQITQSGEAAKITYLHNAAGQRVFKSEPQTAQTLPNEAQLGTGFVNWLKRNFQWLYATAQTNATLGTSYNYGEAGIPSWAMTGEYGNGGATSTGRTEYIWLPTEDGAAIPIAMFRGNRYSSIHSDHLGTPRLIKDDTAKPTWQWAYSAFGDNKPTGVLKATTNPNAAITNQPVLLVATNPATVLNLRFPGQYADSETGLFYNYFRSYQPNQGRYTQGDPIGLDGGWNRFNYGYSNALSFTDPTGEVVFIPPAIAWGVPILAGAWWAATRPTVEGPTYAKPPENAYDPKGPKAPGQPGPENGYFPPKGGPNWVPNPNPGGGGSSHGWEDKKGDVWCPTGQGGRSHSGPHWDVQTPGGGYRNVKPPR